MTDAWWEDEDGEVAPPAVTRPAEEPGGELWAERYPRPERRTPPPGLTRRQQRRWQRDVDREQRREIGATATSWRRDRPASSTSGFGVVLLVAVLALCGFVWLRSGGEDSSPVAASAPTSKSEAASLVPSPSPPPEPSHAEDDGHDHADPVAPVGLFEGPAGETAYAFVLGYLTYSPAAPDPVDAWTYGWERHATDELVDTAEQQTRPLWDFTVQQAVHVTDPRVLSGLRDGDRWLLNAAWTLFPIGGDETTQGTGQEVTVELAMADGLVASVTVSEPRPLAPQ